MPPYYSETGNFDGVPRGRPRWRWSGRTRDVGARADSDPRAQTAGGRATPPCLQCCRPPSCALTSRVQLPPVAGGDARGRGAGQAATSRHRRRRVHTCTSRPDLALGPGLGRAVRSSGGGRCSGDRATRPSSPSTGHRAPQSTLPVDSQFSTLRESQAVPSLWAPAHAARLPRFPALPLMQSMLSGETPSF